jgi:small-conductance mechanosensitive channel
VETFAHAVLAQETGDADGLRDACGSSPDQFCEWVYDRTENETLSTILAWAVDGPLRIIIIVLLAFIAARLLRRAVGHFGEKLTDDVKSERLEAVRKGRTGQLLLDERYEERSKARTETLTSVLASAATLAVWTTATLLILGEFGISLAPLIAGAGIAGVAIGFGAQTVVRDFLAGFFMLVEDQYGVGDVIDVGPVTATVEKVTLRTTKL